MKRNHDDKIGILKKPIKILGMSILEIIFIITYLIVIVIVMAVVHETGHILGALAAGISLNGMKIGISNMNPEVVLPSISSGHYSHASLEVYYYSGGFLPPFSCFVCISYLFTENIVSDHLCSFGYWGLSRRDFAPNR